MVLKKTAFLSGVLVTLLALTSVAAVAQESSSKTQEKEQAAQPSASETEYDPVAKAGLKTKIFEIKYGDPRALAAAISPLRSDASLCKMTTSLEYKTITVRDFPENLAAIEGAIKRLDKPSPAQTLEFHVHIILASVEAPPGKAAPQDYPPEAAEAIKQLRATLKYKHYVEVASNVQRAAIGDIVENRGMIADHGSDDMLYSYSMVPNSIESGDGVNTIQIHRFKFEMTVPTHPGRQQVGFDSPLRLREGEEVVVGTTTVGEGAVVVVLVAKILH